jgi:hypothetical protein
VLARLELGIAENDLINDNLTSFHPIFKISNLAENW